MNHQDEVLQYVLDLLEQNYVPTRILSGDDQNYADYDQGLRAAILHMDNYEQLYNDYFAAVLDNRLYYLTDEFVCTYLMLRLPQTHEILLCGPVIFEQIEGERLEEIVEAQKVPKNLQDQLRDYYRHVAFISRQSFYLSIFTLLADHLFGKDNYTMVQTNLGEQDAWKEYYAHYFRVPDKPFLSIQMVENRYASENALITAVQSGNETRALEEFTRFSTHFIPARLDSRLRDMQDYAITLNTLLRKAAEQAGVHPIHIDNLSNSTIQQLERATSVEQCSVRMRESIRSYCRLIRRFTLNQFSPLMQKVLTCIFTDLAADLSLRNLSDQLNVNASYLSTLFRKEMGTSLTDYVNRSRIRHAQHLLHETNLPIKTIAQQCGIPDVYYFGRLFKRITGTPPGAYRESTRDYNLKQATDPDAEPDATMT